MNIKAITAVGLGLSLLFSTSTALAQSEPEAMPASPTPDGTMTPEPPPEVAPPEETITPESTSPVESTETDANMGGVDAEGTKLVVCGPNGAATTAMTVRPGCHHLTVNSPPGVL